MADYTPGQAVTIPQVDTELSKIATAIASKVDENGGQLLGTLDANEQRIINLPEPVDDHEAMPFGTAKAYTERAEAAAIAAESSELDAEAAAAIAIQYPEGQLAAALALNNSSVLVGGEKAGDIADTKSKFTTLKELGAEVSPGVYNTISSTGGKILLISEDITLNAPITFSGDFKVVFAGKFISAVPSAQDSNLYPAVIFDSFSGQCLGTLRVEIPTASASETKDGVQFINSSGFSIEDININNLRFHVITTNCSGYNIGRINGDTARGWQGGLSDNGGSILTSSRCSKFKIGTITGDSIYKAAVYLSIDGLAGDNTGGRIEHINVSMAATNVANGLALRSAVDVSFGHVEITGGIAALYASREESEYNVDRIVIDKLVGKNNNVASSNSFTMYCFSFSNVDRVGSITVGEAYCLGSANTSLLVTNVESLTINKLTSESPATRAVQINGTNGSVVVNEFFSSGAASNDILTVAGSLTNLIKFNNLNLSTRVNETIPINIAADTYSTVRFGDIVDETATPTYSLSALIGVSSSLDVEVNSIKTNAANAVQIASHNYAKVKDGKLFSTAAPAISNWYIGKEVFNNTPSSGQPSRWINNGAAFVGIANLP